MRNLRRLWNRALGTLGLRNPDTELDDELAAHLALLTDEYVRSGMEPAEAHRHARLKLGAASAIQQEYRTQRGLPRLEIFLNDLRQATRALRNAPAFTIAVVLTLGVAIGANTAIFSLVNQALFNLRGVYRAERVISIREHYGKLTLDDLGVTSGPAFADVRKARDIFQYTAALNSSSRTLTGTGTPQHIEAGDVTSEWFDVLGAKPILGRTFTAEEDQPNAARVAVLSNATWIKNFGADPGVIGRTIELDRQPYKVIGVMPQGIEWIGPADLWIPLALKPEAFSEDDRFHEYLFTLARLRDGVSTDKANAWMQLLSKRVIESAPPGAAEIAKLDWRMFTKSLTDAMVGDTRTPMLFLLAAVGLVLLIAASNVAGLMLARNSARSHELAVQAALGASRARILSRTFAESLILAVLGTGIGLVLAMGAMKIMLTWLPEDQVSGLAAQLDAPTLAFTAVIVAVAGLLFGLIPAWFASQSLPYEAMRSGTRTTSRQRLRSTLVIAETALALVLIVAAAALLRSFTKLEQVNPGFIADGVTTAVVSFPPSQYPDATKQNAFYTGVLDRLPASSAIASSMPFQGGLNAGSLDIKGRPTDPVSSPHGDIRAVSPGFFELLKIPVRSGRVFTRDDRRDTPLVAVIDERMANQYWKGESPVGQQVRPGDKAPWFTIVGVVGHIAQEELTSMNARGTVYFALLQSRSTPTAAIATRGSIESIRAAVAAVDPSQAVYDVRNLADRVASTLAERRFVLRTMSFFALTALLLAALGLYGVIGYAVSQRTRELGIRFALGARTFSIIGMVVRDGLRLAAIGAAIGLASAVALAKYFDAQLYQSSTLDTPNIVSAAIILLGVSTVASLLPARRAASVDPLTALRCE
jgi:predicted permease